MARQESASLWKSLQDWLAILIFRASCLSLLCNLDCIFIQLFMQGIASCFHLNLSFPPNWSGPSQMQVVGMPIWHQLKNWQRCSKAKTWQQTKNLKELSNHLLSFVEFSRGWSGSAAPSKWQGILHTLDTFLQWMLVITRDYLPPIRKGKVRSLSRAEHACDWYKASPKDFSSSFSLRCLFQPPLTHHHVVSRIDRSIPRCKFGTDYQ